jgi:PilZ domain
MSINRRRDVRRTVKLRAEMVRGDGLPALPCTVMDISQHGARLAIAEASDIPAEFVIVLTPRGVPYRKCRLIRRGPNKGELAVEFETHLPE